MRDAPQSLMIFAAGFGTRMMPLTRDKPKPMVPVAGQPLIDHALDLAQQVEPDRIVANLHYKGDVLRDHLKDSAVTLVTETPDILDTGGGLRNALPHLGDGPVWTMNPDVIWRGPNPLALLKDAWDPAKMDALLICINRERARGTEAHGDFHMDATGRLTRGPGVLYGGAQIIRTDRLMAIPETAFSLNIVWDEMIAAGRCFGLEYPGHWCDVGHPAGITVAEDMLRADAV